MNSLQAFEYRAELVEIMARLSVKNGEELAILIQAQDALTLIDDGILAIDACNIFVFSSYFLAKARALIRAHPSLDLVPHAPFSLIDNRLTISLSVNILQFAAEFASYFLLAFGTITGLNFK